MPQTPAQKAAQKKWVAKNKDKVAAYAKTWRARNPEQAQRINARAAQWRKDNPAQFMARVKQWQKDNPEAFAHSVRKSGYQRKFGITIEQYDAMFTAQKGVCAICSQPPGKRRLAVDHCHTTKAVRGLLCVNCNTAIGNLNDDPELFRRAIAYLFFYQ